MRAVLQRVSGARVEIEGEPGRGIGQGFVVLLGIETGDSAEDIGWLVRKLVRLRLFDGDEGEMSRSILDCGGDVLLISQFTLLGTTKKGTRPSYNRAAAPFEAVPLYEAFIRELEAALGKPVATGTFGAEMRVALTNDGPVTLILDSKRRDF
ncbi:MAG: D-aminoacyl-tRNA deacylase [Opitutales bacterium]